MSPKNKKIILTIMALVAVLVAGALYADRFYESPQEPPTIVYTIKGPVILYEQAYAGDLITAPNLGTIYYLNKNMERLVFPDEQTYNSWYDNFDEVKNIPQDLLESYPLSGRNATIRPGTYLVTIPSSNQVWMIGSPNILYWLADGEQQVIDLFGSDWMGRLTDLPEYYFTNYTQGPDFKDNMSYPAGLLFYSQSDGQYYITGPGGQRIITEKGLHDNHYQTGFAIIIPEPLSLTVVNEPIDAYGPRWGSPDPLEQTMSI